MEGRGVFWLTSIVGGGAWSRGFDPETFCIRHVAMCSCVDALALSKVCVFNVFVYRTVCA